MNTVKPKYTPGPWAVAHLEGNTPYAVKAQNRTVAWVDFWQDKSYVEQVKIDEQTANAALIAQAPALLDLLADGALQFQRLTGPSLEAYARTFAVLASNAIALAQKGPL